jgi:AhpD family alkylhydroperoxidase
MRKEDHVESRVSYIKAAPGARDALLRLSEYVSQCGLEEALVDLVCLRASQINGCAFCIDMHWKDLRALGQSEEALYMLDAWRESPGYTERERAALAWTEAVTLITEGHVPDEVYQLARKQFSDAELANLTLAVAAINSWNRMNIAFRTPAGHYRAPVKARQAAGAQVTQS